MKSARQRVTKQHLTRAIGKVAGLVRDQTGLLNQYRDAIEGTEFLRLQSLMAKSADPTGQAELAVETTKRLDQKIEQVCLDSCVLLVVALSGEADSFQGDGEGAKRMVSSATDRIAAQYRVLEKVDEAVWDSAREAFCVTKELATRERLDVAERLLFALNKNTRKTIGAYFTPTELAEQVVDRTARMVQENLGLANGFADTTSIGQVLDSLQAKCPGVQDETTLPIGQPEEVQPFLTFADPAVGVGAFLIACLNRMKVDFVQSCDSQSESQSESGWQRFLGAAIKRVRGVELHPALAAICHFRLFSHYRCELGQEPEETIPVFCGDALCEPVSLSKTSADRINLDGVSVVLGNPPFGSLTVNSNTWVERLLRGKVDGVSFFQVDGQPLNERKHWLHDDYVKFFRLGLHLIRRAGAGVVSFVSNRSYLDNLTFRAMRWQMLEQFAEIEIKDLAGCGEHFPIVAEVATGVFCTHSRQGHCGQSSLPLSIVEYQNGTTVTRFSPDGPEYLFRPTATVPKHYRESVSLPQAMPFNGSVAITARDYFVTDIDRDALCQRVAEFCDLSIPDDMIRSRYFQRTRSRRYLAGDTRSWKMSAARKELAELDWESHIRGCDYRPFDRRWVLWCDTMIDWPRNQRMSTLDIPGNFALLARRQFPLDQPACYFWATSQITIDGILRSDNRGNETMFPVWVRDSNGQTMANFTDAFLKTVREHWKGVGIELPASELPRCLAQYIYGLFHCTAYRVDFHPSLSSGFPRIVLNLERDDTELLINVGKKLLDCHLGLSHLDVSGIADSEPGDAGASLSDVVDVGAREQPVGTISYCPETRRVALGGKSIENIALEDWNFRVGTHQVLRKWLKARKGQGAKEISSEFLKVVAKVQRTRELMQEVAQISFGQP